MRLPCPRHKGELWEIVPTNETRKSPSGGMLKARTDHMTPQDRMNYFNKAGMEELSPVWTDLEDKVLLQYFPNALYTSLVIASKTKEVGGHIRDVTQLERRYTSLLSWTLDGTVQLQFDDDFPTIWPTWWEQNLDGQVRKIFEPAYRHPDERKYLLTRDDLRSMFRRVSGMDVGSEHLAHRFLYILHRDHEQ